MAIPFSSNNYGGGNSRYSSKSQLQSRLRDSGKMSVPSSIFCFPLHPKHHLTSLKTSFQAFTKKTGAGYNKGSTDTMVGLIEALVGAIQPIQQIMSSKQVLLDIRLQTILLTPWISHLDHLLNNIIRLLNDRVSMLWRKQTRPQSNGNPISQPCDISCGLHDDVTEVMNILQKLLQIFTPRQVTLKRYPSHEKHGANQQSNTMNSSINLQNRQHSNQSRPVTPTLSSTAPPNLVSASSNTSIVDCELSLIIKQLVSRCHSHLLKTFPTLLKRIEKYLSTILSSSLEGICNNFLIKNCFVLTKHSISSRQLDSPTSIHMFGFTLRDTLLQPIMLSIKIHCKSRSSIERIMTLTVNNTVDYILNDVKDKKLRFNEYGVYLLYTLLNTILQWSISSKTDLGIPISSPLILDLAPWLRANSILQILLLSTSGGVVDPLDCQGGIGYRSVSNSDLSSHGGPTPPVSPPNPTKKKVGRHLTIFEYERWVELGVPPKICCISVFLIPKFLKNHLLHGAVSLSTTLDFRDL